jgi:hypothetical protein
MDTVNEYEVGFLLSFKSIISLIKCSSSINRVTFKSAEHAFMERLLSDLQQHPLAWAFLQPVNADEVPDYYDNIKRPMGIVY